MKLVLAQINTHIGDFEGNTEKILSYARQAKDFDLCVFPELCLLGYAPYDLLERPELFSKQQKVLKKLIKSLPKNLGVLVGALHKDKKNLYNAALFLHEGKLKRVFKKELLPSYDVFYEKRFFTAGRLKENLFSFKGKKILVSLCEDVWAQETEQHSHDPFQDLGHKKIDLVVNLSASPYEKRKQIKRERIAKRLSKKHKASFAYVNQVGAQDELIFDGQSFFVDQNQNVISKVKAFEEKLLNTDIKKRPKKKSQNEELFEALKLGIRDYFKKTGFKKAHLGLSGGIDSALVLVLACEALGKENVCGIALPGPYNAKLSLNLAKKLSANLGTHFKTFDIKSSYKSFVANFETSFSKSKFGLMHENTQARLRALALMAYSNQENSLLLATSNKSELCVGYSTLYGDQCGALMPLGDLLKTEVFELCKWYNDTYKKSEVIPKKIITRPPSAELRPNQKDSDSLPDYKILDASIERVITNRKSPKTDLDHWVLKKSYLSEFKRWQAGPILRVSSHAFGRGRNLPLAHKF